MCLLVTPSLSAHTAHTTDSQQPHCVPRPPGFSTPATAARDHQHQVAAARCSLPSNACLSETWTGYHWSQALEPNLTCARERDYLTLISARGMAMVACAHCSYGQASDISSTVTAQHWPGWRILWCRVLRGRLLFQRCREHQLTQDPREGERITVLTIQVPHFLLQTPLSVHFWLSTTQLSEPGSLKKWTQCAGPPERSLIVCAKNNLNFCFYRIQGPISSTTGYAKHYLFSRGKKIIYAVHYQSQMVMFKHKFDELYAA